MDPKRRAKLKALAESRKVSVYELVDAPVDGDVAGICMNHNCSFVTTCKPGEEAGLCKKCETKTVMSALVLGGVPLVLREGSCEAQKVRKNKLDLLAEEWGMSLEELIRTYSLDGVAPGICMNPHCDYSTEYEPDQDRGWCEECRTNSVASALVLAGIL